MVAVVVDTTIEGERGNISGIVVCGDNKSLVFYIYMHYAGWSRYTG